MKIEKYINIVSDNGDVPISQPQEGETVVINNQDITITENGVYSAGVGYTGIGTATVEVPSRQPVIDSLSITPTTSAQTITAPEGTDGYSPISVDAVTAAIDNNITANNIKSGVSILGVSGNVVELNAQSKTVNPATWTQQIQPDSSHNALSEVLINPVTSSIDNNIIAGNIKNGVTILGVTGNYSGSGANIDSLSIIPTTSQQTITASGGVDGYSPITVSAVTSSIDANIIAGNIKDGVTILGVTGNYTGGGSSLSREFQISNGVLVPSTTANLINLSGVTSIGDYALLDAYKGNSALSGILDLSSLTSIQNINSCQLAFEGCHNIEGVNLSNLTIIAGSNSCVRMFYNCSELASVNFNSLTEISGMWGLTTYRNAMFEKCVSLTSVNFPSLSTLSSQFCMVNMFKDCTSLTSLSFPAFKSTTFGNYINQINNIIYGVTGCTIHFPSNLDPQTGSTVISGLTGYPNFGGTNTVLSFDLPATT